MLALVVGLASPAHAITLEDLESRLAEVAPLRAHRNAEHAPQVPDDAWEKVARGKVATGLVEVDGSKFRKVYGVGVVDVPIGKFFSAINDERNKPDYTSLQNIIVLNGEYCGNERTVFQFMAVPMLTDRWWVIRQSVNPVVAAKSDGRVREMSWRPEPDGKKHMTPTAVGIAASGMEVTMTYGGWFLVDLGDGQTLVEFWSWSDPGGNIPVRMASSFAARSIENTLGTMSELANKGPSCDL